MPPIRTASTGMSSRVIDRCALEWTVRAFRTSDNFTPSNYSTSRPLSSTSRWRRSADRGARTFDRYPTLGRRSSRSIPLPNALPDSEGLLCSQASFLGDSSASVSSSLADLRRWQIRTDVVQAGSTVLRDLENMSFAEPSPVHRPAVSIQMMDALRKSLDLSNNFDACVWAVVTLAFWGQIHLDELLPSRRTNFDSSIIPSWNDLGSPNVTDARTLYLPWAQNGGTRGATAYITCPDLRYSPTVALASHRALNMPENDGSECLGTYISSTGIRKGLTKRALVDRIDPIIRVAGVETIKGHSFRNGGAHAMLECGIPPDIVKVLGRWSSDDWLMTLATLYVENLHLRPIQLHPSPTLQPLV